MSNKKKSIRSVTDMQLAELSALWWLSDSQAARRSANFAGTLLSANFAKRAGFLPEEPLVSEVKRRNLQCDHRPRIDLPKCTRISGSTDGIAHKTYCKFWATRLSVWKLRPIQILGSRRPSRISNRFKLHFGQPSGQFHPASATDIGRVRGAHGVPVPLPLAATPIIPIRQLASGRLTC